MRVVFDNIIFALQRVGGISVVWQELLSRALQDETLQKVILDYPSDNVCRKQLDFSSMNVLQMPMRALERYRIPAYSATESTVFHSSYFRIIPSPNVKNITTVHDLTYHYYRRGLPRWVHLWEEQRAVYGSAGIICVSEHTKADLLRFYPALPEERVAVVYNGVGENFVPDASVTKQGYLLFVGNRAAVYKRFDVAVHVARLTGLPLVMIGAPLSEQETAFLNSQLTEGQYSVYANVSNATLNTFYNEALCLLYPSDYEGFGIPILEAQRAGCPVLCQAVSSIPEVMGDGGLLLPKASPIALAREMADMVRQMLSGQIHTADIIAKGLDNAQRFSWDKTYRQTREFYAYVNRQA